MNRWIALALASLVACGGDDDGMPDAGDASLPDAEVDASGDASEDSGVDVGVDLGADGFEDAGVDADVGPEGLCATTVTYRATAATPTVFIAGTFNDFDETADELVDDGTGTYSTTLWLEPGVHPYKLVVNGDGEEPWRFDPANPYRAYAGGVENSGLRVPDCFVPRLVPLEATASASGEIVARFRFERGRAGALASVRAERRFGRTRADVSASIEGDEVVVSVTGAPEGKHTISVIAVDDTGLEGPNALAPVWVESAPFAWDDAVVYVVMPDRFRNGDISNDPAPVGASPGADFEGGDLQGLTQAIEEGYFDDLGVNALWVTPWMVNPPDAHIAADDFHRVTGYHGYWPTDPLGVDERFGGPEALEAMVEAAHAHGIRILMDLVLNHVHEDHPYVADHPDWFNTGCVCGTADCDWTARRLDCLFRPYMPDIDWTNLDAQEQFLDDAMIWLERYDLDGFRVDAVKHVVDGAVFDLRTRVAERFEAAGTKYFLMGETAMGWDGSAGPTEGSNPENYGTISRYVGPDALDGQFDFVLYYAAALQFLGDTPGRGMAHVDFWTKASLEQYPSDALMTPYIGSHDTPRWVSLQSDPGRAGNQWDNFPGDPDDEAYARMALAMGWMLSLPGVPLMYYGDEYGQAGGADPDNRRMMRFGDALTAAERAQRARIAAMGLARAELPGLRSRAYRTLLANEDQLAVARGRGDDTVVVLLNRSAAESAFVVPVASEVLPEGTRLRDRLGGASVSVERAGLEVRVPGRGVMYLAR